MSDSPAKSMPIDCSRTEVRGISRDLSSDRLPPQSMNASQFHSSNARIPNSSAMHSVAEAEILSAFGAVFADESSWV